MVISLTHALQGIRLGRTAQTAKPIRSPLTRLVYRLMIVTAIFVFLIAAVLVVGRRAYPNGQTDLLPEITALVPGRKIDTLSALPCGYAYWSVGQETHCFLLRDTGRFQQVMVAVYEGRITAATFAGGSLRVIDLVYRWGPPDHIRRDPAAYALTWDKGIIVFTRTSHPRLSNLLDVKMVSLMARDQ